MKQSDRRDGRKRKGKEGKEGGIEGGRLVGRGRREGGKQSCLLARKSKVSFKSESYFINT